MEVGQLALEKFATLPPRGRYNKTKGVSTQTHLWYYMGMDLPPRQSINEEYFPRNLMEFDEWFSTEDACETYLIAIRWPEGFRCPRCGNDRYVFGLRPCGG